MEKKIVLFMPSVEGGGVEKNFFIISNFLKKKIKNTFVITAEKNLSKKIEKGNIIYPKSDFWRNKNRPKKYLICLILLIKFLLQNKNVIIFSFQANLYAIVIAKLFGQKIISRSNSSPSGWSNNFVKKILYKIGLKLADKIIVNSIEFKNEMKKKFSINVVHIYNPLDKERIIKLSKKNVKNPFQKKTWKIINVGRLVDQKDQMTLLKAINYIKNRIEINLIIIGRGKNKQDLLNFIKDNKLNKLVKIFYTNNPYPYIKLSDVFVLSSIFEGLPNVLLEAASLKKFIISSDCPTGPKEILDQGKGGDLFKCKDFKSLGKKILESFNKKRVLDKKIQHNYKKLIRFESKVNLDKYLNIIETI